MPRIASVVIREGKPGPPGPASLTPGDIAVSPGQFPYNKTGTLTGAVFEDEVAAAPAVAANTAAVARVAPATIGGNRQFIVIIDGQPTWFDESVFDVSRFATPAQAFAEAVAAKGTVYFPLGAYDISGGLGVVNGGGVTLRGAGRRGTILQATSGDLITLTGAHWFTCEHMYLRSLAGAGHVFKITDSLNHGRWVNLTVQQDNPGKSILYGDDGGIGNTDPTKVLNYIDGQWEHIDSQHTAAATVATFHLRGGAINRNTWRDIRPTYSGEYTWLIEATMAQAYADSNRIEDVTGEVLDGGIIKLLGCKQTTLANVKSYDNSKTIGTTRDLISLGKSTFDANLSSQFTTLINTGRVGGVLGAGLYDLIDLGGIGSPEILLINCANIPGSFAFNANHHHAQVLGGLVALTNGENVNVVPLSGGATVYPGQVRVGSLGVGNAVAATTPGSVVKKVEVFDINGVSLGFIPVYSSIT